MTTRLANPTELERAARRLEHGAAELEHLRKAVLHSARPPDWEGTGGDSMRTSIDGFANEVAKAEAELRHMAHDLRVGAHRVRDERDDRRHDHKHRDKPDGNELVARRERITELVAQRQEAEFDHRQAQWIAERLTTPRTGTTH